MSSTKPFWFAFNVTAWLSSKSVRLMSLAERGAYIGLLATAWGEDVPGTLPVDEDEVRRMAEMSPEQWALSGPRLLKKFPLSDCGTYRYNPRLLLEGQEQRRKSDLAAEAGRKSAEAKKQRKGNGKPTNVAENSTDVEKTATERQLVTDTVTSSSNEEVFAGPAEPAPASVEPAVVEVVEPEPSPLKASRGGRPAKDEGGPLAFPAFWEKYHEGGCEKRGSKKVAETRWNALAATTRTAILAGLDVYRANATRNGSEYLPYAEKFLNPKRAEWANEGYGHQPAQPVIAPRPAPGPMPAEPISLWGPTTTTPNPAPIVVGGGYTNNFQ